MKGAEWVPQTPHSSIWKGLPFAMGAGEGVHVGEVPGVSLIFTPREIGRPQRMPLHAGHQGAAFNRHKIQAASPQRGDGGGQECPRSSRGLG
jgi:hypothetical protein